jgi:hypothetical protein
MLLVIFKVIRKDKDVVNIGYTKDIKERTEDFVNLGLKSNKSISKTKRHNKCFKKAIIRIIVFIARAIPLFRVLLCTRLTLYRCRID